MKLAILLGFIVHTIMGKRPKGEVIAVLTLPGYTFEHYVIGIDSAIETLLEIRDDMSMAHSKNDII